MPSRKKHDKKQCNRHQFQLKPKSHTCFYQQTVNINFCNKQKDVNQSQKIKSQSCYEGPVFNKDNSYLTSSFIMSSQKKKYIQNGPIVDNQNKYYNFHQEKSQMLVPKPNSKNMYCNACKQKYEDYLQHIRQPKHKKRIQTNVFTHYITELQAKYKAKRSVLKMKQKQLTLTETSNVIVIDQQQNQILQASKPNKKIKRENPAKLDQNRQKSTIKLQEKNIIQQNNNYYYQIMKKLQTSYYNLMQLGQIRPNNVGYQNFYPGINFNQPDPYQYPYPYPCYLSPALLYQYYTLQKTNMELFGSYLYSCGINPGEIQRNLNADVGIDMGMGVGVGMDVNRPGTIGVSLGIERIGVKPNLLEEAIN